MFYSTIFQSYQDDDGDNEMICAAMQPYLGKPSGARTRGQWHLNSVATDLMFNIISAKMDRGMICDFMPSSKLFQ